MAYKVNPADFLVANIPTARLICDIKRLLRDLYLLLS